MRYSMRAVRVTGAILAAFVVVIATATPSGSGDKASEAEVHLRRACEVMWTNATDSQIEVHEKSHGGDG